MKVFQLSRQYQHLKMPLKQNETYRSYADILFAFHIEVDNLQQCIGRRRDHLHQVSQGPFRQAKVLVHMSASPLFSG